MSREADLAHRLLEGLQWPAGVVDARDHVIYANRAAVDAMSDAGCALPPGEAWPELAAIAAQVRSHGRELRPVMVKTEPRTMVWESRVWPLDDQHVAVVLVEAPARVRAVALLGSHLGLEPAEARLVLKLSRGQRVRDIASSQRVDPRTIKMRIGRIYRKLGLKTRGDLVALVASMLRDSKPDEDNGD